ncbi:hypothetical protein GO493_18790 [Chitinophaga sp. ysch24]|uniref:Uncharacterized protein n=1 Tax=Chitinophaga tropicalis TaxID=2683588 RepID=A0A7K1U7K3_9BACT|nr:hypothetical protein [Chitinophaga tropicalis]
MPTIFYRCSASPVLLQ